MQTLTAIRDAVECRSAAILNGWGNLSTSDRIQFALLVVQVFALVALICYAIETVRIRKAAQRQVKTSQDQIEGMSKPCLTFRGQLRDAADVILEAHGSSGIMTARADQGSYVLQNIGNGVALNVRYQFTRVGQDGTVQANRRYIPYVTQAGPVTLIEGLAQFNDDHRVTLDYESFSGRSYRTTIQLNRHVIAAFAFEGLTRPAC